MSDTVEKLISPLATLISPSVSGSAYLAKKGMEQVIGEPPAAQQKKKPKVMPVADDEQALAARRRSIATQRARSGRAATILTSKESLG